MTERLYYTDSHMYSFTAKVINVIKSEKISSIVLDKTAFFPEGGGQTSDTGLIGNCRIVDVREDNGIIYHYSEDDIELNIGDYAECHIDELLRFSKMQSHTGEHILSGIAHNLYGVDNVGFHMDENLVMTVDFNKFLSKEEIALIEQKSNKCIYENLPVTAVFYSAEDAKSIEFRSKIDFDDTVRVVAIGDIDNCACCAPHVSYTGEIGIIKVLQSISHRGGVRLTVICGNKALNDYFNKHNSTANIAAMLCSPHDSTDNAVALLVEQNKDLKRQLSEQKYKLLSFVASSIDNADTIVEFFDDFSMDELRILANELKNKSNEAVFLFSGNESSGYSYCILSDMLNLSVIINELKSAFNVSGGGRGNIIQGKIFATQNDIRNFLNEKRLNNYENAKKETS